MKSAEAKAREIVNLVHSHHSNGGLLIASDFLIDQVAKLLEAATVPNKVRELLKEIAKDHSIVEGNKADYRFDTAAALLAREAMALIAKEGGGE